MRKKKEDKDKRVCERAEDFITHPVHIDSEETSSKRKESLGDRIRKAREILNLSIAELSNRTGIASYTLKRIEANEITPPLGDLVKLGKALETKMSFFISPGAKKPMTVVRADQREETPRHLGKKGERYGYFYESLAPEKANRLMEPFMVTLTPAKKVRPSTHDGQEFLFVLEGKMMAQVGGQKEYLEPGDAIYYDSSEPHFVKCVGRKQAKVLAVLYEGR